MNPRMAVLMGAITLAAIATPVLAETDEDRNICKELTAFEAEMAKRLPMAADTATQIISMRINCKTKVQLFSKRLAVSESQLAEGWRERKQRQHIQLHCNRTGLARTIKWTVIDVWYDKDTNLLAEFVAKPEMCSAD